MAMVLTEEQAQLQDAAKKFIQERSPISALRKLRDDNSADGIDRDLWKEIADLGWAGILIEEDFGGLGLTPLWMGLIMEEVGRCLSATPLMSTAILGASLIQKSGSVSQKEALLSAIASGDLITALALDETAHHNPSLIKTTAKKDGDNFVLNGEKVMVLDGHIADKIIVAARSSGADNDESGISLFIVDADAEGMTVTRTIMADSNNAAKITFNNTQVNASQVLGELDHGFSSLDSALDVARACLSAEMLGSVQESLTRVVEYLKTRTQFDTLIGSFQGLQHRAADMFVEIELSKSVVREALNALDEGRENSGRYVSMAQAQICETSMLVSNEGVQMFGGIGMTDEEEIGFFMKRSRAAIQAFGNGSFHTTRYATLTGF